LYCARHTFGTAVYEATGNLAMVMKAMGHADARTAMRYQHPALDLIREAIDQRNLRHNSRYSEVRIQ
jgi:integrase